MRLYGLIGYPLTHSFSAGYFKEKFKNQGIADCEYWNFPISTIDEFPQLLKNFPEIRGLNVTIPYKEKVMNFLDEIEDKASGVGAVNTIRIDTNEFSGKKKLTGYNTDTEGFHASLQELLTHEVDYALVLGTGGASKAVIYILKELGIKSLSVSRKPGDDRITYRDLNEEILKKYLLIINTTPIGMFPETEHAPELPYQFLTKDHILHDLIYNPAETLFMRKGKFYGATVRNGYQMLVEQAERSWKIWNEE